MTRVVDVGTPSSNFEDWTTTNVRFHGFADITTEKGERVVSPEFSCFGHQWRVVLYPGGNEESNDRYVALGLSNMSNQSIKLQFGYTVRDAAGKEIVYDEPSTIEFGTPDDVAANGWGIKNFARRSTLLDALIEGGTLIIEVRMRLKAIEVHKQFIPKNPINNNILKSFMRNRPT